MNLIRKIAFSISLIAALSASASDKASKIKSIELNISVLQEQFDYTFSECRRMKKLLPEDMGLYEGQLVGKHQLESQIRKKQAELRALTGDPTPAPTLLSLKNNTPLKLLITLISDNPEIDQIDYFLFQEMDIKIPVAEVKKLQISDYREDNVYPIYRVETIEADKELVLELHGGEYLQK